MLTREQLLATNNIRDALSRMTGDEMRAHLRNFASPVTGTKEQMAARLMGIVTLISSKPEYDRIYR